MHETATVVVIGGGTTGCGIVWRLAREGVDVRLVERSGIAAGSSGASPGIVRQYYPDPALVMLASAGLDVYRHWRETVGGDCGYRRTGFFTAVALADEASVRVQIARLRTAGVALEWVPAEALQSRCHDLAIDGLAGAVHEADAGYCDPRATALAFADDARSHGAVIDTGYTVRRIRTEANRVTGIDTDRGRIDCALVVNAAGPWSAALAAGCGAALPISASRQCVVRVRVDDHAEDADRPLPVFSDRQGGFYLRPDLRGHYLIGTLQASDSRPTDPDNFARTMNDAERLRYRNRAARRFARLRAATPVDCRVSFFDDTPDGNPLFGPDPRVEGLFVAAGLSGHGFKFAPVFGQEVAGWLRTGQMRPEMKAFEVRRVLR
jgi:glycine/D-amino acid oxidase-like deaminating enzyme